jgi:hypothetical protein
MGAKSPLKRGVWRDLKTLEREVEEEAMLPVSESLSFTFWVSLLEYIPVFALLVTL